MLTFKIQRLIYHKAGSLLPFTNKDHIFLQIYFIRDQNDKLHARSQISTGVIGILLNRCKYVISIMIEINCGRCVDNRWS